MRVRELNEADSRRWDEFVQAHAHGSPFHLIAWKRTIEDVFGYRPVYLLVEDESGIQAILPMFLVHNFAIGRVLVSLPFAVYGGALARGAAAREALGRRIEELVTELDIDHVELRNAYEEQSAGLPRISQYVTFTRETPSDEDELFRTLPKKTRNMVRKSLRYEYETRRGLRSTVNFERLYSKNLRRLGTPAFPRKLFVTLLDHFGPMVDIREVLLEGTVVAASLNFYYQKQMHVYYAASDEAYLDKAPNNYMYFDYLRAARSEGFEIFDFGRCKKDTGTFAFKRKWNPEMRPLPYEVVLGNRQDVPNNSPTNPRFRTAINVWKKLPLPLTRHLGPHLVRLFP